MGSTIYRSLRRTETEHGISSDHRVQDPDVLLPPEPESPLRRLVDHVGQVFVGGHVLVIDDPETVVDNVGAGDLRFGHSGDLENERLLVTFQTLEVERDLALVLDPLVAGSDVAHASLGSWRG